MPPNTYVLTFTVPVALRLSVIPGKHLPCLHGCLLVVDEKAERVRIEGPSRESVFEQARRFLKVHARKAGPLTIDAVLRSPAPGRGADSWSIICNAEISFAATVAPPDIGRRDALDELLEAAARD